MDRNTLSKVGILSKALIYNIGGEVSNSRSWHTDNDDMQFVNVDTPLTDKNRWQGRFVYCPVTFRTRDGRTIEYVDAIVSVTKQKIIQTTQVVGMTGTIKEYISSGDYEINMYIGLYSDVAFSDEYPESSVRELVGILESDSEIGVQSAFLDLFDINRIVIKNYSLLQQTDSSRQEVSLSALSDDEYNVYSTDY